MDPLSGRWRPAYVTTRLKLTDLAPMVIEAFYAEEIGLGHALLLAKLPQEQQEQALTGEFPGTPGPWKSVAADRAKRISGHI